MCICLQFLFLLMDLPFYHYKMLFSLVTVFVSKSILFGISVATPAPFLLLFAWHTLSHPARVKLLGGP